MNDQALSLTLFVVFVVITLGITLWASRQTRTAADFYSAGRRITGWQNGVAISGDYMSAASFLGIAGLISLFGYDGFLYSVGWLVAYLASPAGDFFSGSVISIDGARDNWFGAWPPEQASDQGAPLSEQRGSQHE